MMQFYFSKDFDTVFLLKKYGNLLIENYLDEIILVGDKIKGWSFNYVSKKNSIIYIFNSNQMQNYLLKKY